MTIPTQEKKRRGAPFGNKNGIGNDGGRPKSDIDWKRVDELLMADCSGAAIAAVLGIAACTLYDRCLIDKGIAFSAYSQQMNSKGESLLREVQYLKAMSGDNALLIWLGKCRMKQSETIQSSGEVKVTVVDYSKSESNSNTPQISTETISTTCSTGA